jgi:hypothetical protein
MNSVYIDSAVSASPIYIGPNNANSVIIGNANCKTTLVGGVKCNNYDRNNTAQELLIGQSVTGPDTAGNVIRIGENVTTGVIAIGNGNNQNGRITIGGSGMLARTIVIGSPTPEALPISSIEINGNVTLQRPLILQSAANYVAPTADIMLGGITAGTFDTPDTSFNANKNIATLTVTKGTYMIYINFEAQYTTLPTTNYVTLVAGTALPIPLIILGPSQAMLTGQVAFFGSVVIPITRAGTIILRYNVAGGTITALINRNYYAVRIA